MVHHHKLHTAVGDQTTNPVVSEEKSALSKVKPEHLSGFIELRYMQGEGAADSKPFIL